MTDQEIESTIRRILADEFEVDAAKLKPETNLFTELDLDSIDAVDLVVRLQQETGKNLLIILPHISYVFPFHLLSSKYSPSNLKLPS